MQNKILGDVSFAAQYAKSTKEGRESWEDAVNRVEHMHLKKYNKYKIDDEIKWAFNLVKQKRVFPSQRSIQFGGRAIELNNMRMFNCTFSPCDRTRFFSEAFWLLLSGCGTGFSIRKRHVNKLPKLINPDHWKLRPERVHIIPDSIEGWSNAAWMLIESYCRGSYYNIEHDKELIFDYDNIRIKGSKISSGGLAPGHKPLKIALDKIRTHLRSMTEGTRRFKPIDCLDIAMYLSEAVLSGGVRRSASIAIFDQDDYEMMTAKQGDWWRDNPQRAYANISASIKLDGNEEKQVIDEIINNAREWGEPGVAFFKSNQHGTNPCAEIGLMGCHIKNQYGQTPDEITLEILDLCDDVEINRAYSFRSGWQGCNLTEINMSKNKTHAEFLESCKAAAFIGTLQAGYTNEGYLGAASGHIMKYEALIGVSLTGMCENELSFNPKVLREGSKLIEDENKRVSDLIYIAWASRTTCIKPSGNTSTVAGGISAGIHPHHAKRYIRRMRLSKINPIWKELSHKVPAACESLDDSTGVVSFACSAPKGSLTREDDTALKHLERVKLVYENWVAPGSKNSRVKGLTHNVSNTCTVKDNEWDDVASFIYDNRESLRGVALLGYVADHKYKMAPYQTVIEGTESETVWDDLLKVDWSLVDLNISGDGEDPVLDPACSGGECTTSF